MKIIVRAVVAVVIIAAAVLTGGCGDGLHRSTSDDAASETPGATVTLGPKSQILPAIVLPSGSRLGHSETTEEGLRVEFWYVPLEFNETADHLRDLLPIDRQFDDLDYVREESGIDDLGVEYMEWSWDNYRYSGDSNVRSIEVRAIDRPNHETLVAVGVGGRLGR